jgi:hypothetical protein
VGELDEEERRLLAEIDDADEPSPNPVIAEPVPIVDADEIVQPPPVETPAKRRGRPPRRQVEEQPVVDVVDPEPKPEQAPEPVAPEPVGPEPENPTAPPVQMDYGDPWGQLPVQMRHYVDGRPAV